ncbi:putative FF domain-containing protein [Rosellinia necatrix]|uniref:Putative FF domain-containing protein n=1 Tax=Rosellinia necatrix TaxID=77044 RepID=A0A1W2TB97_ROSNE|nr:putative FF domain-containing protein [Rosellinia necatrix]
MNGVNGHYGQPNPWQEIKSQDGRVYYHNPITKATQWTKPEEMMTPAERALANQPWKEYTAEGGRKYWYNTETKQSSWEMPDVYRKALGYEAPSSNPPPSASFNGSGASFPNQGYDNPRDYRDHRDHRDTFSESRQLTYGNDSRAQAFTPASNEPEYTTAEEAEAAFTKLLRRSGVQPDWTWEQAMRAMIKDPQFRAIKDPKDRKAAFENYCHDMIVQDKERAKDRLTKLRADFAIMLKSHPEIKHYTRWKTARPMIEGETIFRSTNEEEERRRLFEDYVEDLKKSHLENQASLRKSAMDGLIDLLPKLDLDPYTRWSEAQGRLKSTAPFQNDDKYKTLSDSDILTVFQNHIKSLERTFNETRQAQRNKKFRVERKNRDAFVELLQELRKAGKIKAGTKWSHLFPMIENNERFKAVCGQPGSTPLDLFWDVVEEEERALRGTRNDILDIMDDNRFELTPKTTFEDFTAVLKRDTRSANIDHDILKLIFERLQEKKSKRSDEDKHLERQQRRAIDDLRSYIKHLDPPIVVDDTWEKVRPRLARAAEFQAVTSEEARRGAFEKVLRRVKDREEEDRDRHKRRDRSPDRNTYRDREKGERPHRSDRARPTRHSRSPEPDAYEADRRKAIAEREKNYRKSSMAESLLSDRRPLDSHRDRDIRERDRDRDHDRDRERDRDRDRDRDRNRERERDRERDREYAPRSRRDDPPSYYDRERRDREEERERMYRRRVERGPVEELPYGDERPTSSRRRRADDEDENDRRDSRDSKRPRREKTPRERSPHREARHKTKTPPAPLPPSKEDAGVHSGSEEGEIEED